MDFIKKKKFWTLYKGRCLRFCEICANPQWIEIYLNFFEFVLNMCNIYICFVEDICIYEFLYLKYYIKVTLKYFSDRTIFVKEDLYMWAL